MTADWDDEAGFYDEAPRPAMYGLGENIGKRRGRYHFPDPPGHVRPKGATPGFMRMTNLASAFSDQKRLMAWRERMIMAGLRTPEGEVLFDEFMALDLESMTPDGVKKILEEYAGKIADAAGAGHGARRGTARHVMLQAMQETGVLTGTRRMRLQYHSLLEALERHHLEPLPGWSERRVCHPAYGVIGTLDLAVVHVPTGQRGILDLKTQRRFWTYMEICGQQFGYDDAPWVWEGPPDASGKWVEAPAWDLTGAPGGDFEGKRVALLAHMPQEPGPDQLPVEIHEVSLEYGECVLRQALGNVHLRSIGGSVAAGRRVGAVRPLLKDRALEGVASRAIAD
jgi:hypothetical protein